MVVSAPAVTGSASASTHNTFVDAPETPPPQSLRAGSRESKGLNDQLSICLRQVMRKNWDFEGHLIGPSAVCPESVDQQPVVNPMNLRHQVLVEAEQESTY